MVYDGINVVSKLVYPNITAIYRLAPGRLVASIPSPVLSRSSLLAKTSARIKAARFASVQYEE